MKVCELLNSMSPLHEIRIKRAYNDAILYRGIVKDAPTCTTERDVCNIYSTVYTSYVDNPDGEPYSVIVITVFDTKENE
jgi:hypothetical protein